jgi:hypothetical protein
MTAGFLQDEDKKAEKMKDVPMGRPSQPEEQAGMAILLLSDRASCKYTFRAVSTSPEHALTRVFSCYRHHRIPDQHRWWFDHLVEWYQRKAEKTSASSHCIYNPRTTILRGSRRMNCNEPDMSYREMVAS